MGIWTHSLKKLSFCVCVDDFGLKYFNQQDAQEFLNYLGTKYKYNVDCSGQSFYGLPSDWNYNKGHVDISMPNYYRRPKETPVQQKTATTILYTYTSPNNIW